MIQFTFVSNTLSFTRMDKFTKKFGVKLKRSKKLMHFQDYVVFTPTDGRELSTLKTDL